MTKEYQLSWKLPFKGLCFTAQESNSTVELIKEGNPSIANTAYSFDGINWTTFTPSTSEDTNTVVLTNIGDKVYFRNDITGNLDDLNYLKFLMSGKIAASGNINSMYDSNNFSTLTTLTYNNCYYRMFSWCFSLTTAPKLPATTLSNGCYHNMFELCTSLIKAPSLPATTLTSNCYNGMFAWCTHLQTAPELPATTLADSCYLSMFVFCTSLVETPKLPVTTLAENCYTSMFSYCSSLTKVTSLPATILVDGCYNHMFGNCEKLKISNISGTKIFTCPTIVGTAVDGMFNNTYGTFTGTPREGETYYYY